MHPLYAAASEIADKLKAARLQVVHLSSELSQAGYDLRVVKAKVERGLIKKVGGEKALGPTVESRARIFTLALEADENYKAQVKRRNAIKLKLEEAKVEVASLRDKLNMMLAAMKAAEDSN
ncbi:MAG: hypothetical protein U9R11_03710 [Chloroflexota bacterium]|nr:hypothetical protein [Chloroflexota bacterium]